MLNSHTLLKISRILLYATAVLPLVLWAGFTFPFVSIRTALFRMVIEVVVVLALFLWARGSFRFSNVRREYFFWFFLGLLAVESVAALFGESPLASFFGDLERMWGIFTVAHLFAFYVLARIFFGEREWRTFFHVSLATSALVSVYGIIQRNPELFELYLFGAGDARIGSTLGNPVFVAVYLLFNMAFAAWLMLRTERGGLWYVYLATLALNFYAFTLTDIRGTYLGLLIGAASAGFAYLFIGKRKRAKQAIGAGFVLATIALALAFQFRSSYIIQHTPMLRRLATISINDETAQTRFIGWNAAWQAFLDDPLTGMGMENYNIAFNTHFPARYYLLAPTETYFDRAHNQFFNILAESGGLALIIYLLFPALIGWHLAYGYRSGRFVLGEFLLFGGTAVAYFVHLFFVFEDFHSLYLFAAFIALIAFQYRGVRLCSTRAELGEKADPRARAAPLLATGFVALLVAYAAVRLNVDVLRSARYSGIAYLANDVAISLANYQKALATNLVPSENITLNFADFLITLSKPERKAELADDPALRERVLAAFAEVEGQLHEEVAKKPNDVFFYLKLGQLNNAWFLFDDDAARLADAIGYLERALSLSPGRIQLYLVLGESYVLADESEKAIEILTRAVNLEPDFGATYYYLGRALMTNGELGKAYDAIVNKSFIEYRRQPEVLAIAFVLAEELARVGEYEKMVVVYEHLARFKPEDARVHSALAAGYVLTDRYEDAIRAAQKAAELDPTFAQEAAVFIQAIEDGRIDELKQGAF